MLKNITSIKDGLYYAKNKVGGRCCGKCYVSLDLD